MMSPWLFTFLLITLAVGLVYLYLVWNFDYWKKRGVNGPKPIALFGTFPCTIKQNRNIIYDFHDIYLKYKNKEKFVGVFMTRNPQLLVLDPQLAHDILITNFKYFHDNESSKWMNKDVEPISGNNPFVLTGDAWKEKRFEIVAGLTAARNKSAYPVMQQVCSKLTKYLRNKVQELSQNVIETKDLSLKFTGEVVSDVVWGIEAGSFEDKECTFLEMSKKMIAQTFNCVGYFFMLGVIPIIRKFYTVRFFPEITDKFFTNLLNDAISLRVKSNINRSDFLNHLIQLQEKKNVSHIDLVAHTLTFLFDGFETSAALISHCLLLLARNKEAQHRLREEIRKNLEQDGYLSFETLNELPYLEQVINETLRLYVPLPFLSKICTEPIELTNTNGRKLKLNIGDIVHIPSYSFHHDEDYFKNQDKFIPERFNGENGYGKKFKDLGFYLPFGDGPRICLGMKFGLAQAKSAIVEVIKNFDVSVNEKTRKDDFIEPVGFIGTLQGGIFLDYKLLED